MGCAALVAGPALAQSHVALSGYNADISQSSISGISSGGFMAVQFGTAWSSVIKGVGVVAGGPYLVRAGGRRRCLRWRSRCRSSAATGLVHVRKAACGT